MNILKQIENYKPYNSQEEKDKEVFLRYLKTFDNYLSRENEYGHICSSAFVLNKERTKIVMIYHNIYMKDYVYIHYTFLHSLPY